MGEISVGFVGGGNMTRAIAGGLLASGFSATDILISEPSAKQREILRQEFPGVATTDGNSEAAAQSDYLVLAVKPQILATACRDLAGQVQRTRPLIISIVAGIRSDDIDRWLGGNLAIVRVMPNQPALLQQGVSGVFANERVTAAEQAGAERIMAAVGRVVSVPREADIDAVTAISGSGPAYFYLLIDMLMQTAQQLGLDDQAAATLAMETASGAAALATAGGESMQKLIARVRSPGGTTAAALDSLEEQNIRDIFARALTAARDRAVALADEAHKQD